MTDAARFLVWTTVSMAWTEIGLEEADYPPIARELLAQGADWPAVRRIALREVCGAFALDSFLIFPCMLWMIMPDWGYNEDYLRRRMQRWQRRPLWQQLLRNPLRLLGYPVALLMSRRIRARLKQAMRVAQARGEASPGQG
jgi:hypothetical protein